jgi:hypothetical protein
LINGGQEKEKRFCLGVGTSGSGENKRGQIWFMYFAYVYENEAMKPLKNF